jgi:hypothetical protein
MNISVAARSKAWVCAGSSLAGNAGSNSARGMDVCPFASVVWCRGRGLCVGLLVQRRRTECDVSECDHEDVAHKGLLHHGKRKEIHMNFAYCHPPDAQNF